MAHSRAAVPSPSLPIVSGPVMISWATIAVHVRCHRRVIALASGFAVRRSLLSKIQVLLNTPSRQLYADIVRRV